MDLEKLQKEHFRRLDDQAPEGYFEQLEDQVISRWKKRESRRFGGTRSLWKWAAAASVLIGALVVFQMSSSKTVVDGEGILAQLPEDQLVEYYLATSEEEEWLDDSWMDDLTTEEYLEILDLHMVDDEVFDHLY